MRDDPDDDALSWGDEADPTHVDAAPEAAIAPPTDGTPRTSSVLLVIYGVFGGAYLIYTVGWIIAVQRDTLTLPTLLGEIMYQFGEFLAIASPALWLAAVLLLTRERRAIVRLLWLAAVLLLTRERRAIVRLLWLAVGLLVVAPWPFFLSGVA